MQRHQEPRRRVQVATQTLSVDRDKSSTAMRLLRTTKKITQKLFFLSEKFSTKKFSARGNQL
jgi:hypothetical protein